MRQVWMLFATVAVCGMLAACDRPASEPAAPDTATPPSDQTEIAEPAPTPMTKEALALCFTAIEAWDDLGAERQPGSISAEDAERLRNRLKLKRMELELADGAPFSATLDQAGALWKDKTPADIEAAAKLCLQDVE